MDDLGNDFAGSGQERNASVVAAFCSAAFVFVNTNDGGIFELLWDFFGAPNLNYETVELTCEFLAAIFEYFRGDAIVPGDLPFFGFLIIVAISARDGSVSVAFTRGRAGTLSMISLNRGWSVEEFFEMFSPSK